MPVSAAYRPDPRFPRLGDQFADPVAAADFPLTVLRFRNDRAAATVGLETLTDAEWVAHFGRFQPLPDNLDPPLALRYHGHQFRVYNPDLGDGRGFLFAQLRETGTDRLLDLGFAEELELILDAIPQKRQNLLFSATYPPKMESIASKIDTEVAIIIRAAEDTARKILTRHRKMLDKVSRRLLEKETIEGPEFKKMFAPA
jgi:hypothetical protein